MMRSVLRLGVFGKVLVAVGIGDRLGRIALGKAACAGLAVDAVLSAGHHGEVAGLVHQGDGLGVGAGGRCTPERAADMDLVRLVRIDIGVAYASARFASQLQLILSWPLFWSSALSMLTKLELTRL